MAKFSSEEKLVKKADKKLFVYLSNLNNFQGLLPPQIKNWKSSESYCTFDIEGTASLGFEIVNKHEFDKLEYKNYGNSPFPFKLSVNMNRVNQNDTKVIMDLEADINPMMKMLVQKPLTNLLNLMVDRLNEFNL